MKKKGMAVMCIIMAGMLGICGCKSNSSSTVKDNPTEPASVVETEAESEKETETDLSDMRQKVDPKDIIFADSYNFEKEIFAGSEYAGCDLIVEAELAANDDGVAVREDDKCSNGEYIEISNNKTFSISVDLPASQFYKISVSHKAGSHKENPLLFNGNKVCNIYSESGDFVVSEYDGIFLNKGENVITLGDGWSWFSMDYIRIENGSTIEEDFYQIDNHLLNNPYANLKTQNIYQYLQAIYGKRTLSGQCTDYGNNTETDALYNGLGKYPAVRTFDFIYDSYNYCKGKPAARDMKLAKEWSKDGGLVVFDWHWFAPVGGCDFYTKNTDFTITKARPDASIDIAKMDIDEIRNLYKEKKVTLETVMLFVDMDNIASLLQKLEEDDVTVLWRPLHEASGGWFWWGATGPDDYIWLWKTMYERMTNYHMLDNLIWVWNAQDPEWYPGDEYCDIAALDVYGPEHDYGVSPTTLKEIGSWVNGNKLVTMSECATMPDPDLIVRDNAYWLWFAVWNWEYIVVNGTPNLSDKYTELDMMKKVYDSPIIITRDELPKFD